VNLGRNVWQAPHPVAMAAALQAIIHQKANVKRAQEIFNEARNHRNF
jgi:putative autoinducer-2 (AI-2) aldolase